MTPTQKASAAVPMFELSDRSKEAFKVALAMALTYFIALSMNWGKPFWAGLSVAFCCLATSGESVNRGLHRTIGTAWSGVAALVLLALFPQDRWPFLFAMSAFLALCTYRLTSGSRYFFIWFCAGFNLPILVILGQGMSLNTFDMVILRAQETALGVVVYSLVAVLVWPKRGGEAFAASVRSLCQSGHRVLMSCLQEAMGRQAAEGIAATRAQMGVQLAGLNGKLEGAVYDSDEIWLSRAAWRRCEKELGGLYEALGVWQASLDEVRGIDLGQVLPGLGDYAAEIDQRFTLIDALFAGERVEQRPVAVQLSVDPEMLDALTHPQRASVRLCVDQLRRLELLTGSLYACVADIYGHGPAVEAPEVSAPQPLSRWVIDRDRLEGVVRQQSALWLTLLMALYVPAFPLAVGVIALTNAFAMILANAPFVPAKILLWPSILGAIFSGLVYMLILPHLAGFAQLGTLIFALTFLICYIFHRPEAGLVKGLGLTTLVILIGVENPQHYSFLYFSNWVLAIVLFTLSLLVAWRFPISFRAEDRFLAMLRRYFRSAEFLLAPAKPRPQSFAAGYRRAYHLHEITMLPQRMRMWARTLPPVAVGKSGADQLQSLLSGMQTLSDRIRALEIARSTALHEGSGVFADDDPWRSAISNALQCLAVAPDADKAGASRERLQDTLAQFGARIEAALDQTPDDVLKNEQGTRIYELLGAYRSVSRSVVEVMDRVRPIDWSGLREARF